VLRSCSLPPGAPCSLPARPGQQAQQPGHLPCGQQACCQHVHQKRRCCTLTQQPGRTQSRAARLARHAACISTHAAPADSVPSPARSQAVPAPPDGPAPARAARAAGPPGAAAPGPAEATGTAVAPGGPCAASAAPAAAAAPARASASPGGDRAPGTAPACARALRPGSRSSPGRWHALYHDLHAGTPLRAKACDCHGTGCALHWTCAQAGEPPVHAAQDDALQPCCARSRAAGRTGRDARALQQRQAAQRAARGTRAQQPRKALRARHVPAREHAPVRIRAHLQGGHRVGA